MLAQKERQHRDVNNKCWLGASESKHTHKWNCRFGANTSKSTDALHTHARFLAQRERQRIDGRNHCRYQSWLRKSVSNRFRWIRLHTHRLQRMICKLTVRRTDVRLRRKTSTLRSRVSEGVQYSENRKDSDNTKDCWNGFLNSESWQLTLADLKVRIVFYQKVVARC